MRRIEFTAKRYLFSDDTLLYRCHFDIGDIPLFKPVPPIEARENLVRRAHYLGHFAFDKTYSLLNDKYYWPAMSRDVNFVINNCISCLKYKKF